ncbi:MAG TPA: VTT domain-containing protein [Casimicrobiaceae bacterium]|nr:VTT domain-containing protein [Casimicrobiaceae bacterium]
MVPGSTIVFVAGVLAGLRALDPWTAGLLAVAGAVLGDGGSYLVGRRYRDAIRNLGPIRRHPTLFARGEAYFAANGRKSIFVGRFLGPLRAVVPLVAGMAKMPGHEFVAIDALAAIAWAGAHLLPGVLFGASLELAGAVSSRLVVLVAILVVGLWLVAFVIRFVTRRAWPLLKRLRERLYVRASLSSHPSARAVLRLLDPSRSEPLALLVSATLLVAGAWLFLGVVEDVVTHDTLVDVDRAVYGWLSGMRSRFADDVMVTISELAGVEVMIAVIAAVAAWLAITRRFRTLAYWAAAAGFAEAMVIALKYGFERARPNTAYAAVDPFSFPSGHAAITLVVYGFLAFLLGHGKPVTRQGTFALAAAGIAALVAFSRVYLGAHWLSDVIASFGLGIAWIALLGIAYIQYVHEPALRAAPVLSIVAATLIFVGGPYAAHHHARDVARYAKLDERPSLPLAAWRGSGWATLPAARTEIGGQREEAFTVQWVASREPLIQALAGAGWQAPARWKSAAALLWLVPSTPIGQLPVLPKLHRGQPPALTFIRALDPRTRNVVRLWHVADAIEGAARLPIYAGMVTIERAHAQWGLIAVTRTDPDPPPPEEVLAEAIRGSQNATVRRAALGVAILLVW